MIPGCCYYYVILLPLPQPYGFMLGKMEKYLKLKLESKITLGGIYEHIKTI